MSNELTVQSEQQLSVVRPATQSEELLHAILAGIKSGDITPEKVAAMDGALEVCLKMRALDAEASFASAFVPMQAEIPKVQATKAVMAKDGSIKYKVAPFEEIDAQVRPILQRHGFTVSFSEGDSKPGYITKVCHLRHGGHTQPNSYTVRIGSGPHGSSESQADGAAHSYAKRGALCDALNIVIGHIDDDARAEGGAISPEQAANLRTRAQKLGVDEKALLKLAGAESYETITDAKAALLDDFLHNKEKVADPLKPLKIRLWNLCAPIRGKEEGKEGWVPIKAWLAAKNILAADRKINELTQTQLQDVINKTEIALDEAK